MTQIIRTASTYTFRKRRTSKRMISGELGSFARKIMYRYYARASAIIFVAGVVAGVVYLLSDDPRTWLIVLGGSIVANPVAKRAGRARVGVRSERRALAYLRLAKVRGIVCGALLGAGGDVDLIAVGPVLVAIEVKTGRGRVTVHKDGRLTAGRRSIPKNPMTQVARNASSVARRSGIETDRIICVVDMVGSPLKVTRSGKVTWICSGKDLPRIVHGLPKRVADADAVGLSDLLTT